MLQVAEWPLIIRLANKMTENIHIYTNKWLYTKNGPFSQRKMRLYHEKLNKLLFPASTNEQFH